MPSWSNTRLDVAVKVRFRCDSHLQSIDSVSSRWPSVVWVSLIQSVEGLKRTKRDLSQANKTVT